MAVGEIREVEADEPPGADRVSRRIKCNKVVCIDRRAEGVAARVDESGGERQRSRGALPWS